MAFMTFPSYWEWKIIPNDSHSIFFRGVGFPLKKQKTIHPGFAVNVDDQLGRLQASGNPFTRPWDQWDALLKGAFGFCGPWDAICFPSKMNN